MTDKLSDRIAGLLPATPGGTSYAKTSVVEEIRKQAAELEQQTIDARLAAVEARADAQQVTVVREPRTYERGNGHSFLCDQAAVKLKRGDGDGGVKAAGKRLERHDQEIAVDLPARLEERARKARQATEAAATATMAELRAFERFSAAGGNIFKAAHQQRDAELRALTRTDGAGGYTFVPPLWLTDDFIPYALAGRPFANLWHNLPLPPSTDEILLPRITLGVATGTQTDAAPAATRDLQDQALSSPVRTVAGFTDLPLQWLDQRPGDADSMLLPQLLADYNTGLDGLCLLGSSALGQPAGIMPAGALGAAQMISLQNTNNGSAQQWAYGGTSIAGSPHFASAQLLSKIATARALMPTAWVVNELVWSVICAAADGQNRPLVPPGQGSPDGTATGHLHGLPIVIDQGLPVTFTSTAGGAGNPYIGAVTAGQKAAVDGTGAYTPVLCGRWTDSWLWEGEYKLEVFLEVGGGTLTARVRLANYVAAAPNRFVWAGTSQTYSGTNQAGGVNAGGAVSYGALTQMTANSVLQSGTGF